MPIPVFSTPSRSSKWLPKLAHINTQAKVKTSNESWRGNRLLNVLDPAAILEFAHKIEQVTLDQRQVLFEAEEPIEAVYFPLTAVLSLIQTGKGDEVSVEVGTVGREGLAGLPVFLSDDTSSVRAVAQIPGEALRMKVDAFREFSKIPEFHHWLLRYTQAFLTQVAQTAVCNAAHLLEQRCCRWLLMTHDRVGDDVFPLTHEFLAFMLGVRRPGVTQAMRALQDDGVIQYSRGRIRIVDRVGLETKSCTCYAVVRAHFGRLLPGAA